MTSFAFAMLAIHYKFSTLWFFIVLELIVLFQVKILCYKFVYLSMVFIDVAQEPMERTCAIDSKTRTGSAFKNTDNSSQLVTRLTPFSTKRSWGTLSAHMRRQFYPR